MISMSKLRVIAFIAAIGVASPITAIGVASLAFAQRAYGPSYTGGDSAGYPIRNPDPWANDYRLKRHQPKHHLTSKARSD
jgi:hypothetical protein